MKAKTIVTILLMALIFVACVPKATVTPPANNVSLIFQFTLCSSIPMYILDTTSNTLIYTPVGDTTSITISLRLMEDELESIHQKALSIGFFDYPSNFVIPTDQVDGYLRPASNYKISITDGTRTNSVSWTSDVAYKSSYAKATQLQELIKLINEIILSHPEVQELPGPKMLCA